MAASRYLRDRDLSALQQMMARLDDEEAEAMASTQVVEPSEALDWLRDLPALWAGADDSGRRLLTEALFEKVEVLGVESVTIHPTAEAESYGSDTSLVSLVGARGFEPPGSTPRIVVPDAIAVALAAIA